MTGILDPRKYTTANQAGAPVSRGHSSSHRAGAEKPQRRTHGQPRGTQGEHTGVASRVDTLGEKQRKHMGGSTQGAHSEHT